MIHKFIISFFVVLIILPTLLVRFGKNTTETLLNYALLSSSIFIMLGLSEVGFRIKAYRDDKRTKDALENLGQVTVAPYPDGNTPLNGIIRFSKNRRRIYELIPNISVKFINQPITIDSNGFRRTLYKKNQNGKIVHIVGLGDSLMFGWGVKDNETYLARLSESLHRSYPDISWRIINMAVPGYNTVMEVETFKDKGLRYNPEIVIIAFVGNDLDLPNFLQHHDNYYSLNKAYLIEFVLERLKIRDRIKGVRFIGAPKQRGWFDYENDPDKVPQQYKDMVGKHAYTTAMQELKSLSLEYNFHVVVMCFWKLPTFVEEICSDLDIPMVEAYKAKVDYLREEGTSKDDLIISKKDEHPSVIGHQISSNVLFDYLQKNGILSKIYEKNKQ